MANFKRKLSAKEQKDEKPSKGVQSSPSVSDIEATVEKQTPVDVADIDYSIMVSTGCTLLDLAISGGRSRYGGIPGGILIEIFGTSGGGKTALLSEILGNVQAKGGIVSILDPEARLDQEYARIYGVHYDDDHYDRPDTVVQSFTLAREFLIEHQREKITMPINACGMDSVAALSTELELEKGDKMGQKRAKDLSQECRKICRALANSGNLLVCTNQVRQGEHGLITPGGFSLEFYTSLRFHVKRRPALDIIKTVYATNPDAEVEEATAKSKKKEKKERGKVERTVGICSEVYIAKSSVDVPYRSAPLYIMFGYGIDDVRGNLAYRKETLADSMFETPDGKRFKGIEGAIAHVEENGLEKDLKEATVDLWHSIEKQFASGRKPKVR